MTRRKFDDKSIVVYITLARWYWITLGGESFWNNEYDIIIDAFNENDKKKLTREKGKRDNEGRLKMLQTRRKQNDTGTSSRNLILEDENFRI